MPLPTAPRLLAVALAALVASAAAGAQIPIRTGVVTLYDFDDMGTGPEAALPRGIRVGLYPDVRVTGPFDAAETSLEHRAGNFMPATAAAGTYNFGAGDSTSAGDRAPGFLLSNGGVRSAAVYLHLVNETGAPLEFVQLGHRTEYYRGGTGENGTPGAVAEAVTLFSMDGVSYIPLEGRSGSSLSSDGDGLIDAPLATGGSLGAKRLPTPVPPGGTFYIGYRYSVDIGGDVAGVPAVGFDDLIVGDPFAPFGFYVPSRRERVFGERLVGAEPDSLALTLERFVLLRAAPEPTVEVTGPAAADFTVGEVFRFVSSIRYRVYFSPTGPGERTATLTFRGTGAESRPVALRGTGRAPSAVEEAPGRFAARAFPNPSHGLVTVDAGRPLSEDADVAVFDRLGRLVARVPVAPGSTQVSWDGATAPAGVYVVRMTAGSWAETARVVIIR